MTIHEQLGTAEDLERFGGLVTPSPITTNLRAFDSRQTPTQQPDEQERKGSAESVEPNGESSES